MLKRNESTGNMKLACTGKSFKNISLTTSVPKSFKREKEKESDAFGLRTNRFEVKHQDNPGPGKYRPNCISGKRMGIAVSRSERFPDQMERLERFRPGPGSYNPIISGSFADHRPHTSYEKRNYAMKASNKQYITRRRSPNFPGPGQYYPYGLEELKAWDKSFSYSFKTIGRSTSSALYGRRENSYNNAPGRYNVAQAMDALFSESGIGQVGAAFRSRSSRLSETKSTALATPAPGHYDVIYNVDEPYMNRPLSVFSSSLDRFGISPFTKHQVDEEGKHHPGPGSYNPERIDYKSANGAVAAFKSRASRLLPDDESTRTPSKVITTKNRSQSSDFALPLSQMSV